MYVHAHDTVQQSAHTVRKTRCRAQDTMQVLRGVVRITSPMDTSRRLVDPSHKYKFKVPK